MIKVNSKVNYLWIKGGGYYCLALAIFLLVARVTHFQSQILSLCVLIVYLLASRGHTYSFLVKKKQIEVSNQLRPYYRRSFEFDDIESIEVKGVAYRGVTLIVTPKHQSKKYFAVTRIKKEELQLIVDEFEKYKQKNIL